MDVDQLLTTTRSARRAIDITAEVDLAEIKDCLRVAFQAANGSNQQSWRWLVVTDPTLRRQIGDLYKASYLSMTGGMISASLADDDFGRQMSSTEWLVEHLPDVPVLVLPCYEPYLPSFGDDESFQQATLYGSIFPAVWNFHLALHTRGYGTCITTMHLHREQQVRELLGIPPSYVQGCLLPVGRLRKGQFSRRAVRRDVDDVVAIDTWDGRSLGAHVQAGSGS